MCIIFGQRTSENYFRRIIFSVISQIPLNQLRRTLLQSIIIRKEGFHVISYQANFASHHTRTRHAGIHFLWNGIKAIKCSISFDLGLVRHFQITTK